MNTARLLPALVLLSAPALGWAAPSPRSGAPRIAEAAQADGRFTTLLAAVKAADLVPALSDAGPLTLFAPTDEAFARLPQGVVADLLRPERRGDLRRVLAYHVVPGRLASGDLLARPAAGTLAGPSLSFGLRVGDANVVQADVACANGLIHVIDRVLLPPEPVGPKTATRAVDGVALVRAAIERGAPAYNAGDPARCAAIYEETARVLVSEPGSVGEVQADQLAGVLSTPSPDPDARAWALRHAFDRILEDAAFQPRMEAPLPEGFPAPSPVGRVVSKTYPAYRAARASGGEAAFWTLFLHIQTHGVKMTAPVEMTLDEDLRFADMAFLYERPGQGSPGSRGRVEVVDLPAVEVLSVGLRGARDEAALASARHAIEARLERDRLVVAGPYRVLGYNSPMVPSALRFWEVQVPVAPARSKP